MQGTIRVPNKWLVIIGLLWGIVFVGLLGANSTAQNEPRIEGLTPAEALERARTLPPQLDWELLYPKEQFINRFLDPYGSGILLTHLLAAHNRYDTTAKEVSEKLNLLEFARTNARSTVVADHAAMELAFVYALQGHPQRSVDLLESIVANGSLDDALFLNANLILARSYRLLGQEKQAEELLYATIEKLEASMGDNPYQLLQTAHWLYFELGLLLESRGDTAAAHEAYKILTQLPVLPRFHHLHLERRLSPDAPAVEGRVTLNGQPIGGIHIGLFEYKQLENGTGYHDWISAAEGVTDTSGVFKIYGVRPGTYSVAIRLPAWVPADLVRFDPAIVAVEPGTTAQADIALEHIPGFKVTAQVYDGEIPWPPHPDWGKNSTSPAFVEISWESDVQPAGYRIEILLDGGMGSISVPPSTLLETILMFDEQNIPADDILPAPPGIIVPGNLSSLKIRMDAPFFTRPGGGGIAYHSSEQLMLFGLFGIGDPNTTLRVNVVPLNKNNEPLVGGQGGYLIPGAQVITSGAAEIEIVPPRPQLTAADQALLAHDYETAITLYEEQLEADPNDEHSLFVLWYLYKNGTDWSGTFRNPERAKELGERLLEITQNVDTRNIIQRQLEQARGNP